MHPRVLGPALVGSRSSVGGGSKGGDGVEVELLRTGGGMAICRPAPRLPAPELLDVLPRGSTASSAVRDSIPAIPGERGSN